MFAGNFSRNGSQPIVVALDDDDMCLEMIDALVKEVCRDTILLKF
jgi:hypothetical protein